MIKINNNISDTLFINIKMKALENELENGILKDEYSLKLYKELEYDFSKFPSHGLSRIGICVRARYFDDEVINFIKNNENPVVVLVGAGLDTRYFRINGTNLNAVFYELDLDDVIKLRKVVLKDEKVNYISSSMFETEWMDELETTHKNANFLFVVEGVLMYFDENLVREFFVNLASRFRGEILCDLLSIWASKNSSKHDIIKNMQAKFKFGIDNLSKIESWHQNIKYIKNISVMKAQPKRWGFFIKILTLIPAFKNATRLVSFGLKK